jgi:hypothetical protein
MTGGKNGQGYDSGCGRSEASAKVDFIEIFHCNDAFVIDGSCLALLALSAVTLPWTITYCQTTENCSPRVILTLFLPTWLKNGADSANIGGSAVKAAAVVIHNAA